MEKWSFQRTRELMTPRALRGMAVNEVGRARISMMVRSMSSNSRPDTLVQDRTPQPHRFLLQRTAGPYMGSGTTDLRCPRNVGSSPNFRRIAVSQQTTVRTTRESKVDVAPIEVIRPIRSAGSGAVVATRMRPPRWPARAISWGKAPWRRSRAIHTARPGEVTRPFLRGL